MLAISGFSVYFTDPHSSDLSSSVSDSDSIGSLPFIFFVPSGHPRPLFVVEPFVALFVFFAMIGFEKAD